MRISDTRLLIFAKAPDAGKVKTRLIPAIGAEGSARLAAALIYKTLDTVTQLPFDEIELWCAPDIHHAFFQKVASEYPISLKEQKGGDLGERMALASEQALDLSQAVLLMGTDCPVLNVEYLSMAATGLSGNTDMVIAPAEDGGYALLGLRKFIPSLFVNMPWSQSSLFRRTMEEVSRSGFNCSLLTEVWDVDRPEDLTRLEKDFPGLL